MAEIIHEGSRSAAGQRLLVLSADPEDRAWLEHCFAAAGTNIQLSWCPELEGCGKLLQARPFDLVLWVNSCPNREEAQDRFLNLLLTTGADSPLLVIGDAPEAEAVQLWKSLGASDYLCSTGLSGWNLARACKAAWLAGPQTLPGSSRRYPPAPGVAFPTEDANQTVSTPAAAIQRQHFFDMLDQALIRCEEEARQLVLFHINVDDFRAFNEELGYQASDQLMALLVERIAGLLSGSDRVVRIGGDDLAVVVEASDGFDVPGFLAELFDALDQPVRLGSRVLLVTVSVGVATYPEAGDTGNGLLLHANRAMFSAKADTGNSYRFYNERLHQAGRRQLQLEAELRQALRNDELVLYFQPRVKINGGGVAGVECLLRWRHPTRGLLGPDEFIPTAERSGLIVPIGYWVIEQACIRLRQISSMTLGNIVFAVNLSFRQFHDRRMTETIFRIIYNANIDTRLLELELTESAMMHDPEYAQRCLRELHGLGISFALDDFGTGFSSLSHLQNLPISLVKIDKSFVQRIESDEGAQHIVSAIVGLSHSLRKTVVAEGVETERQLAFLRDLNCDQIQGFYYARPLPWPDLIRFLEGDQKITPIRRYQS